MTLDEIQTLAADGESETLELKLSIGELRTGVRTACAMLNHRGGTVLFGVQADGKVIGHSAWRCVRAMAEVRGGSANSPFPPWIRLILSYFITNSGRSSNPGASAACPQPRPWRRSH